MKHNAPEMIDIAFDLKGGELPADYAFGLWQEVVRCLPWLEGEKFAGIHPLRASATSQGLLLPQRAKLVLRVPAGRVGQAGQLSGQALSISSCALNIGGAKDRPLFAHSTLHAHVVESDSEEEEFLATIADQLRAMNIGARLLCGKRHTMMRAERPVGGYSLVLHDMKPDESLQMQYCGLGGGRRFGSGIFVPYKAISGLG